MGQANVPWEWDYQMCTGIGTSLCALKIGLANVLCEWDYPMCPGNGTSQWAL